METAHKCGRAALFLTVSFVCFGAWRVQARWAQTLPLDSSAPQSPALSNCHISGLVVDAGTGKPMPGAQVMVFSQSSAGIGSVMPVVIPTSPCVRCDPHGVLRYRLRTDATGHFAVRGMEPGVYAVTAVADGYAEQVFDAHEKYMRDAFRLLPGQERDDIVIRLPRASVLAGRVIDEHGEPVPGSLVQVLQHGPAGALQKMLLPVTGATTDDRGEYRVFGLLPGRYYLVAGYQPDFDPSAFNIYDLEREFYFGGSSRPGRGWKDFPPLFYYPGSTDPSGAKPVNLEAGQVVSNLDISVRPMTGQERAAIEEKWHLLPPLTGACEASGMVINAVTGQPVRNAWMFLGPRYSNYQHTAVRTRTDAEGRFDLQSIPCYWSLPLAAHANGFVKQPEESESSPAYFCQPKPQFRSQHKITGIEIKMVPTGVIAGKITDAHGNPVECAHVAVALPDAVGQSHGWRAPYRETVTDDQGRYRLFDLPAGEYYVAAQTRTAQPMQAPPAYTADLRLSRASPGVSVSPYIYYPHATTPGDASLVRLARGEQMTRIDFSLSPVPTYEISGTVQGTAWRLAGEKVRLMLVPAKGAFGISLKDGDVVQLGSSGHFRILGVPPGSYVLWAVLAVGMSPYAACAPVTVSQADVTGVTLDPQSGWTVHGHLTVEGQPDSHFQYRIIAEREGADFLSQRVQANDVHSGDSFELNGLFPGRYRIRIEMWPRGGYIKSATFGSQDVRTKPLEISQHQPAETLELVASWDRVQIQGTVLGPDGHPVPFATVVLAPAPRLRRDERLFRSVPTYSGGHFVLQGIPPGNYTLFAWDKIAYCAWFQPGFLDGVAGHGVDITVAAGQKQTVTLQEIVASGSATPVGQ